MGADLACRDSTDLLSSLVTACFSLLCTTTEGEAPMEKFGTILDQQYLTYFGNIGKNSPPQPHKAAVIHLPTWKDHQRGVPNVALRSALFAAVHEKDCTYVERKLLPGPKGFEIRYT